MSARLTINSLYLSFGLVAGEYARYRPQWPKEFAVHTLEQMGFQPSDGGIWRNMYGQTPVVVCVGAGAGSDAKAFLEQGCKVYLVDIDKAMLGQARQSLDGLEKGEAVFVRADSLHM